VKPTLHLVCNAHLDPVWQWRWEEGCAEALSTFAVAVQLLREHPTLIFNHNEAVLYQWVLEHNPNLFRQIQDLARAGRWCIAGGWFLQPDVNLPDTESLFRQILYGRRFFLRHFGAAPRVAYNFDAFGHSGGLPQILRQSGYELYIHLRPQAHELDLPADLYRWRGLDGSEILALRIAVGLYHTERDNLAARLEEGTALALALGRDVPVFWGLGNHGGGPTRRDLETIDAFARTESRVAVRHSTTEQLLDILRPAGALAPVVEGDLQRVFTGCYTSLARVKRAAVRSLASLVQAEALATVAWFETAQPFPHEAFVEAWRDHLFNDFHDILPGSCIEPAEQDALNLYGKVAESTRRLRLAAAVAFNRGPHEPVVLPLTVLNANPAATRVPVEFEAMLDLRPKWTGRWHLELQTLDGHAVPCQEEQPEALLPFNGWRRKIVFLADLPAVGARHYRLELREGDPVRTAALPALNHRLDPHTGLVAALELPEAGNLLAGLFPQALVVADTADSWGTGRSDYREVIGRFEPVPEGLSIPESGSSRTAGPINRPVIGDNSLHTVESGPIRTVAESEHRWDRSRLLLRVIAYAGWPVLELRFRLHWNQERQRLKLAFPTVLRTDHVLAEVPGGAILRPADGHEHVHRRWLCLEQSVAGHPVAFALVHDGCHGFDCRDGELRLSVLRGAAYCHEQGFNLGARPARKYMDQGIHDFRILVAAGAPGTLRATLSGLADWLAAPPAAYPHLPIGRPATPDDAGPVPSLDLSPSGIRLLACKPTADSAALVLRLQETAGAATDAVFRLPGQSQAAVVSFAPWEIKTLRCERDGRWRPVHPVTET
jgi:alpha-mannosidase